MTAEVALERLLAGDQSQAPSKLLRHEVPCLAELVLVGLRNKVFGNQLASRDAGDGDRSLDDGKDDLRGADQ